MNKEVLLSMSTVFRDDIQIKGYYFGTGTKAACIVGAMRGNEYQQLYICAQLIKTLKQLEMKGAIVANKQILVIPSLNSHAINIGKKYWAMDNSDINRQFPGNKDGEATSRIAAKVMEVVDGYAYGIQFPSFYLQGEFIPHVRMAETGHQNLGLANLFGLPYVLVGEPRAFDQKTLNYNWQLNGTSAFSVYTSTTRNIDEVSARQAVAAVLRFLTRMGIIRYQSHNGYIASVIEEEDLLSVKTPASGILHKLCQINQEVKRGDLLAQVLDPYDASVIADIVSPVDGIVFFADTEPIVYEHSAVFRIIKRLHE